MYCHIAEMIDIIVDEHPRKKWSEVVETYFLL